MDRIGEIQQLISNKAADANTTDILQLDFTSMCRICLAECTELCDLYQTVTFDSDFHEEIQLKDIIDEITATNNKIEHCDDLPQHMCLKCTELSCKFYSFKRMCAQSDVTLHLYLQTFGLPKKRTHNGDSTEYVELIRIETAVTTTTTAGSDKAKSDVCIDEFVATNQVDHQSIDQLPGQHQQTIAAKSLKRQPRCNGDAERPHKKSFVCSACDQKFAQAQTLARHSKIHQLDQRNKMCPFCGKCFIRSDDLKRHVRIHTGERPFACSLCPKRYKQTSELKEHQKSHSKEKLYVCSTCGKALATRNGLYVHMKKHRGEKNHACNACDKRFVTSGELTSHTRHIHPANNVRPFQCTVPGCGRGFVTKVAFNAHTVARHTHMTKRTIDEKATT